jgi:NADH-quinone oxidoreductase subunit A
MVDYGAIFALFAFGGVLCAVIIALSVFFGPRNTSRWKRESYESGSEPIGDARIRFDVKFYMVAISFIMFDVEAVFLIPWAINGKALGMYGFVAATAFILVLVAGLIYEWRKGGLEWD